MDAVLVDNQANRRKIRHETVDDTDLARMPPKTNDAFQSAQVSTVFRSQIEGGSLCDRPDFDSPRSYQRQMGKQICCRVAAISANSVLDN